jgi:hypothetical protein
VGPGWGSGPIVHRFYDQDKKRKGLVVVKEPKARYESTSCCQK